MGLPVDANEDKVDVICLSCIMTHQKKKKDLEIDCAFLCEDSDIDNNGGILLIYAQYDAQY